MIRAPGARHASIRFVTGLLNPFADREGFLAAAGEAVSSTPVLVVRGADTPPKSCAEMQALAAVPGVREVLLPRGKLSVHEEFADETAAAVADFLIATEGAERSGPGSSPSEPGAVGVTPDMAGGT